MMIMDGEDGHGVSCTFSFFSFPSAFARVTFLFLPIAFAWHFSFITQCICMGRLRALGLKILYKVRGDVESSSPCFRASTRS